MSIISSLSSIGSSVNSLTSLLTGGAPVTLGTMQFTSFEVPEHIDFPVTTKMVVTQLVGGARIVSLLGDDPGDIAWSGTMLGITAQSRYKALEAVRAAGQTVSLVWGTFAFQVVVKSLTPRYLAQGRIDYQIACLVMPTTPQATTAIGSSALANLVGGDVASSINGVTSGISNLVGTVQGVIAQATPVLTAGAGLLGGLGIPVGGMLTNVLGKLGTAGGIMSGITSLAAAPTAAATALSALNGAGTTIQTTMSTLGNGFAALTGAPTATTGTGALSGLLAAVGLGHASTVLADAQATTARAAANVASALPATTSPTSNFVIT